MLENQKPILLESLGCIYPNENSKTKQSMCIYACSCGKEFVARKADIDKEKVKSCGCLKDIHKFKHGLKSHALYSVWNGMIQRVTNSKSNSYHNYGGRGIEICDRWLDIKNFIDDMYPSFEEGLSIDRINNDGNYEPSNCRWTVKTTQSQNTRRIGKTNTSGYRGVSFDKSRNRWKASITYNNKQKSIGCYRTALEAAVAYDKFVVSYSLQHTLNDVL